MERSVQIRRTTAWTLAVMAATTACALAAEWRPYGNARFNYWIDIPPGFSAVNEAENGDGGSSESAEGNARLSVWGSYLTEGSFRSETKRRVEQDRAAGWTVRLQKLERTWAVWSGSKGTRIFYERATPACDGAAAYFRLEYDKERAKAFDAVIVRLGKSLRAGTC
jgi:hypothetical protein